MEENTGKKIFRDTEIDRIMEEIYEDKVSQAMSINPLWARRPPKYIPGQSVLLKRSDDIEKMVEATVQKSKAGIYFCTHLDKDGKIISVVCTEEIITPIE